MRCIGFVILGFMSVPDPISMGVISDVPIFPAAGNGKVSLKFRFVGRRIPYDKVAIRIWWRDPG